MRETVVKEVPSYIFAKEPVEGRVKTRLCPPLSPQQAARCHLAFVSDIVTRTAKLDGAAVHLACSPDGASPVLARLAGEAGVELVAQGEGDLGERMGRALQRSVGDSGAGLILGADVPDLPLGVLERALWQVSTGGSDVVLGPAEDGGYYLIGARCEVPGLFDIEAEWGGSGVLEATVRRIENAGASFALLPRWCDVDSYGDLVRLAGRLRGTAPGAQTDSRATRKLLGELVAEGVSL